MWMNLLTVLATANVLAGLFTPSAVATSSSSCAIQDEISQRQGPESLILGDASSTTGVYEGQIPTDAPLLVFSASKLVTAVVLMRLVEQGRVDLHDKVHSHLDWWTADPADPRSGVTLYHLISQTAVFGENPCTFDNTTTALDCGRTIYEQDYGVFRDLMGQVLLEENVVDPLSVRPGQYFFYSESPFVLLGLVLTTLTNQTWNDLFWEHVAVPSGMLGPLSATTAKETAQEHQPLYVVASPSHPDPGAGLWVTGQEYARFLHAYYAGALLNSTSLAYIEMPHTLLQKAIHVGPAFSTIPEAGWGRSVEYGLGCWVMCDDREDQCSGRQLVHSTGAAGFLPWLDREIGYWGIIVQFKANFESMDLSDWGEEQSMALLGGLLPLVEDFYASGENWTDDCENLPGDGDSEDGDADKTGGFAHCRISILSVLLCVFAASNTLT